MQTYTIHNKTFYKTMLVIGLPIMLQQLVMGSLNLVDTFMISGLGETAVAALGVANRIYFFLGISLYGVFSACGIFTAQYWGKRDIRSIHHMMGIMVVFAGAIALIFTLLGVMFPTFVMGIFTKDALVINSGVTYLRVVALSYMVMMVSYLYAFCSRSVHMTTLPMIASTVGIGLNTLLNYALIYGKWGLPEWGILGAAVATVFARMLELVIILWGVYGIKEHPLRASFKDLFSFSGVQVKRVIKKGYPVFVNESTWALGNTVYFIAYGLLGTSALAIVQITYTVTDMFQALFIGLGSACAVMVGNAIGEDNMDKAFAYSKRFISLTLVLSLGMAGLFYLSKDLVLHIYKSLPQAVLQDLSKTMVVTALYQIPKMFTFTMIVGILRSGGDTEFCMVLDLLTVWAIGVPLGFFVILVLKWPIHLVVAAVFFEEWIKVLVTTPRFLSKKWMHRVID